MSAISHVRRRHASREAGFTLIEVLVTILAGSVVMLALFGMLDFTLKQTTRTDSYVDATQRSRNVVETLENEMHSACLASGETPIQAASSGTTIEFVSQFGNAANVTPMERLITFDASGGGTLTESDYAVNGGQAPNWTFSTTPQSTKTLLTNISLQNGSTAMFSYFAYAQPLQASGAAYTDPGGNPYMMLIDGTNEVPGTSVVPAAQPLAVPLSAANSQIATEISMSMSVGPSGGTGENTSNPADTRVDVNDSVVLRLTPAANHVGSGNSFLPCA